MNKAIAKELKIAADQVAENFSRKNREMNYNQETFEVHEIIPTSDHSAIVSFKKNTGKMGLAFFYYINRGMSKGWRYFFPTDSHINGFRAFEYYKYQVEKDNYIHNFNEDIKDL